MEPEFFANKAALRAWFEQNHASEKVLVVGYYKTGTGRESITWSESVDEALCFGWIDGIRKSIDNERYCIRFTPRKPNSNWSAVNIKKVEKLIKSGKMRPDGLAIFSKRRDSRSRIYSYETAKEFGLPENLRDQFTKNSRAWSYFQSQATSYRKVTIRWAMSAKQEATRLKRLQELISSCEAGQWIRAMRWGKKQ